MSENDARWALLDTARPLLLDRLAERGVTRIDFVAAFPQDDFSVWLCMESDVDRDALGSPNPLLDEVRVGLVEAGFTSEHVRDLRTVAQSQETVDREYDGSWFYAMR